MGLAELKEKTKELSVLYVEDSPVLQKKMAAFLGKLFKTVHQAENGMEGIRSFKANHPNVVITDIDMPELNGHDMIQAIKKLDPEANIIVYSAYADSENLLKSIHLGVVDFIPKPVDIDLFEQVLTKVVTKIDEDKQERNFVTVKNSEEEDETEIDEDELDEIFKQLDIIKRSKKTIEFINHYKGVPIYDKGRIHAIEFDKIVVDVPYLQSQVIKYENSTVLVSELFENTLEATLEKFNSYNNTLVLKDLRYLDNKAKKHKEISVEPNGDFSCQAYFHRTLLKSKALRIADEFIILEIDLEIIENEEVIDKIELVEGDSIDLKLLIQKQIDKTHSLTTTLDLTGELYYIQEADDKYLTGMILLEIDLKQKEILDEYVMARRQELIVEFKHLKDEENK